MPLILCIETATPVCSVALSQNGKVINEERTNKENAHSSKLTVFIENLLYKTGIKPEDIDAIAVSKGPGSYTGLRIGVSASKGLCYALDIPLISVSTLLSMATGMRSQYDGKINIDFLCPMIDARRMEVYTSIFNRDLKVVKDTSAEIIDKRSFASLFLQGSILFAGTGASKCRTVINHPDAVFLDPFNASSTFMAEIAENKFRNNQFEDVAYFEPFYLKDFIAGKPRVKGLD
ncbi:MAG: tRNA (adenosine(37)-N6)-threonylcarbamoyltransferase complex dimerization subunit type 1 TsaB [Bacteroidales bacterium]|nr:tRNA (adenosine(37)-N6)-threonylcarbamoyltransferase complex dimerization subunit type 1 TsaB [Bacteroidales bacterium]